MPFRFLCAIIIAFSASVIEAEPIKVLIVGDSTVKDYPAFDPRVGWGQVLPTLYDPEVVTFSNWAVGGRSSKSFIVEGFWQDSLDAVGDPDYVLIQFGHNDNLVLGDPKRTLPGPVPDILPATGFGSLDIDWYRNNIRTYINDARAIGAVPVIVTPMERRLFDSNDQIEPRNLLWAEAAAAVAQEENVQLIDLNTYSVELLNSLGVYGSLPMHPIVDGVRDNTHTSSYGAARYAQFIASQITFADADFGDNWYVDIVDLNLVVKHWNRAVPFGDTVSGDFDGDGFVGQSDLLWVVNLIPPKTILRFSDFDGDDFVGIGDLNILLSQWNASVPSNDLTSPDVDADGFVGLVDLSHLLSQWNTTRDEQAVYVPSQDELDLDGSGDIGVGDLNLLLASWSFGATTIPPPPGGETPSTITGDFNADGLVDISDLRFLLAFLPDDPKLGRADLNADGFIGIEDLIRVLTHFGQTVEPGHPLFGDVTGDGFIGIEDLNSVLGIWNTGTPPPGIPASVPEPACFSLFCLAVGLVGARRRIS